MSLPVIFNNLVPLCFLAHDRDETLFVRARIYNLADTLLATKDLSHVEEGRYTDATFFMPSNDSIKVRYDPYTDNVFTKLSKKHGSKDDRFHKANTELTIIRNDELIGVLSDDGALIAGVVGGDDEIIVGEFAEDKDTIEGVVASEELIGVLDAEDTFTGVVTCL